MNNQRSRMTEITVELVVFGGQVICLCTCMNSDTEIHPFSWVKKYPGNTGLSASYYTYICVTISDSNDISVVFMT
jgi:hypothetical protein